MGDVHVPEPSAHREEGLLERASVSYERTSGGSKKVTAPPPIKVKEESLVTNHDSDLDMASDPPLKFTYPAKSLIADNAKFCPDCGLRLTKHAVKPGTKGGKRVECYMCPEN